MPYGVHATCVLFAVQCPRHGVRVIARRVRARVRTRVRACCTSASVCMRHVYVSVHATCVRECACDMRTSVCMCMRTITCMCIRVRARWAAGKRRCLVVRKNADKQEIAARTSLLQRLYVRCNMRQRVERAAA